MRRSSIITTAAVLAAVALVPASPAESAWCGDSVKNSAHPRCMQVLGIKLAVHDLHGRVVCHFKPWRKFNTERGAGSKDGRDWYSVKLNSGKRYYSELRTTTRGKKVLTIGRC